MARSILLITHEYSETGYVKQALLDAGHIIHSHEVFSSKEEGQEVVDVDFPDPSDFDAVIAFGSFAHVYEVEDEWVAKEIAYIAQLHEQRIPYLGICFGAQLLAESLGGRAVRARQLEVGLITFEAGATCPIPDGPWFCWHSDKVELPEHVSVLATTPIAPQVFQAERSIGVQFHPELVGALLEEWIQIGGDELDGVLEIDKLRATWAELEPIAASNTRELLKWFLDS